MRCCSETRLFFLWVVKCLHVFTIIVILTPSAPLLSWWMWRAAELMKSTTLWGPSSDIIKYAKLENMISVNKMLVALQFCNIGMLFPLQHPYCLFEFCCVLLWCLIVFLFSRSCHLHFSVLFLLCHCSLIECIAALVKAASVILFTDHMVHSTDCSSLICWIWLDGPLPLGAD